MNQDSALREAVNDGIARALAALGLCGVALIHLLDTPSKFDETPYLGVMYVGLIITSLVLAAALVWSSDRRLWLAAGLLPAAVAIGYILSRTTGLPSATSDVGNWGEPLGIASLFVEGALAALSAAVLRRRADLPVAAGRARTELSPA